MTEVKPEADSPPTGAAGAPPAEIVQLGLALEPPPGASDFNCSQRFEALMASTSLQEVFQDRFSASTGKGIDRLNGVQFTLKRPSDLADASRKCLDGTFRFAPYLEVLKPKGRDSKPRVISIPTIRDRVILHQLKALLGEAFPHCVPRSIAGTIVREIAGDLPSRDPERTYVAGCDIKQFYDTLHHDRLLKQLSARILDDRAMNLIRRSIVTPTVPAIARRRDYQRYRRTEGVAQGIATANILAAIYISPIDQGMSKLPVRYFRYVDDVLIYGDEADVRKAQMSFVARARRRGLSVHKVGGGKSHITCLKEEFRYLGYIFDGPTVTVRPSTIENLLQSLAAKFSDFKHNKNRRLERYKYLTLDRLKEIFVLELNERISGAVHENRRYGWVAYFSQITDLSLLHRLDHVVRSMFERLPEFGNSVPPEVKSFARAYFEMKYRPHSGYARDFDAITTGAERLAFLVERGLIEPTEALTDLQIEGRFNRYMHSVLKVMKADEATIY
jgi:RNA-directed DNA polymerase